METKKCSKCEEEKEIEDFHWRLKAKKQRHAQCKACSHKQITEHYSKNKQYYKEKADTHNARRRSKNQKRILQYLTENPCVDCGETDPRCLTFDHVRGKKVRIISNMYSYGLSTLMAEIQKCDVRCANCHMKKTADDFGYFTSKLKPGS